MCNNKKFKEDEIKILKKLLNRINYWINNAINERNKKSLTIIVTNKCNINCGHCLIKANDGNINSLKYDHLDKIFSEICNNDIDKIVLTGGEPTLEYELLGEFQKYFYRHNKKCEKTLITNGYDSDILLKAINKIKLNKILISHDIYHKQYVSQEKIYESINICKQKSILPIIITTIKKLNELLKIKMFNNLEQRINIVRNYGRNLNNIRKISIFEMLPCIAMKNFPFFVSTFYLPNYGFLPCYAFEGMSYDWQAKYGECPENFLEIQTKNWQEIGEYFLINIYEKVWDNSCEFCELLRNLEIRKKILNNKQNIKEY